MKTVTGAICALLVLLISQDAWAAKGAIPPDYHGMWGAGGCSSPLFFFHIEASGIQGYGPDKRTPAGNWDVRKASQTADGIAFDTPETNTGKDFYMEISKVREGWLSIKMRTADGTDQAEFEECSLFNQ
ncbi:MAG: hypothetical protein GY791_14885 [Alphaproteobacteria bacterium]|nr:hypothetical protein [Alphaproteobacteria bacterium]